MYKICNGEIVVADLSSADVVSLYFRLDWPFNTPQNRCSGQPAQPL